MNLRWFGSVATLVAAAGLVPAQAPLPAPLSPATPPAPSIPLLANGSPAPAELVERQKVRKASVLTPVVATTDTPPQAPTPPANLPVSSAPQTELPPAAPAPAVVDGAPAAGLGINDPDVPYRHVWARSEYLLWYLKKTPLRDFIGTIPDKDVALAPSLPADAITPAFGGRDLGFGSLSGVRLELGVALDSAGDWAVSGEFFQLEHASRGASLSSNASGSPTVGPIFFDTLTQEQTIIFFSQPGVRSGEVQALDQNRLWGFEVDGRRRLTQVFSDRLDLIVGYRHIGFDESLDSAGTSNAISPAPSSTAIVSYTDHFGIHNNFDGAVIGLEAEYDIGRVFIDARGKFGIGNVQEQYTISGSTNFTSTDPTIASQHFNGGVLAQPSNSGTFSRDRFDFLGDITINAGVRFCDNHVKAFVGYSFLGLSKVARVDEITDSVNGKIIPSLQGPFRSLAVDAPSQRIDDGRFWAQGLNLGLSVEY